jgi:hypothetical protein
VSEQTKEGTPEGRATTFQAVQGEPEHYNGGVLLVTAYGLLWVILLVWVGAAWRRQRSLDDRLAELEKVIADADAKAQAERKP